MAVLPCPRLKRRQEGSNSAFLSVSVVDFLFGWGAAAWFMPACLARDAFRRNTRTMR